MIMTVNINNHKFNVKSVFTLKDTQNGMMGKKFNKDFNGMLFLMDDTEHCFWMKNCIINLDIIFINGNEITKIYHNCPPCNSDDCENYCASGDIILEVAGGTCKRKNIFEGDYVEF
jgi:uncharacterized membrane protein (UPF0127 family)